MKNYTLILFFNKLYHVCSTNEPNNFLKFKRRQNKDLQVLMLIKGDYRRKIRCFGIRKYLRAKEGYDWYETLNLQMLYNRGTNV